MLYSKLLEEAFLAFISNLRKLRLSECELLKITESEVSWSLIMRKDAEIAVYLLAFLGQWAELIPEEGAVQSLCAVMMLHNCL